MMYLVIHKLLVITKIHCYLLLRVSKVLKNKLRAEMYYQLYYILSRALLFENSCSKVSGLLFMFVRASTLSKQRDMHFLGATRPAMVFFSCEMAENTTRNAGSKFVKSRSTRFSTQKRNLPLKKLTCV